MKKLRQPLLSPPKQHLAFLAICPCLALISTASGQAASPNSNGEPIVTYTGNAVVTNAADGGLQPVMGTHNIQVYRANRNQPAHADGLKDTYVHAPMLAYWKGFFHLDYLSAPVHEHETPTQTSYTRSADGLHWETPRILFPAYQLPNGTYTLNHQRMSFYIAPNDKLLATAFYGEAPKPNDGSGLGRAVREIMEDGSFGPIYFIRYNQQAGWNADKVKTFPFYTESSDPAFVEACESLLTDVKMRSQWWEEDRSEDGFYPVMGKAMSYYKLLDGTVIGLWKDAQTGYSLDNGATWKRAGFARNLEVNSSKYWGQRTSDNRFALAYNPTTRLRHPLAVMTGNDGIHFDKLASIHGELPVQRYPGHYKNMGPQYVRGIVEGNGTPPDGSMWLTYSVNKEDIWISRVPVPISTVETSASIYEDFSKTDVDTLPTNWNCYSPLWAPVNIVKDNEMHGSVLSLENHDSFDYASATRVFKTSQSVVIEFDLLAKQENARLEIDVLSANGLRPVQIALTPQGTIEARHEGIWKPAGSYLANQWNHITLDINPGNETERFQLLVNGEEVLYRAAYFTDYPKTVERITFRTGNYRRRGDGGHDLTEQDHPSEPSTFLIDNLHIQTRR